MYASEEGEWRAETGDGALKKRRKKEDSEPASHRLPMGNGHHNSRDQTHYFRLSLAAVCNT
jgi:hypothetical protein